MTATIPDAAPSGDRIRIGLATDHDRRTLYRLRHVVYAEELRQHRENPERRLSDALDAHNLYIVASVRDEIVGFISVTPPGHAYSIDKYLPRQELPFACDEGLYEVRLLTVLPAYRSSVRGAELAGLLVYAALRLVESRGGRRVVAIGRLEVLKLYRKIGLQPLGRQFRAGAVTFELMSASLDELRGRLPYYAPLIQYVEPHVDWRLGIPYRAAPSCFHGGASFEVVGDEFDQLPRRKTIINADVLDAWFRPAPEVLDVLHKHLAWATRTAPPSRCEGLVRAVARARGVPVDALVPGGGSSDLIFRVLPHWLTAHSRVLLVEPVYGEYPFVLEQVVGCCVERLTLPRPDFRLPAARWRQVLAGGFDLVILVNPNNPSGAHLTRTVLEPLLRDTPATTRVWIDEAYTDYVGAGQSMEQFAAASPNVVVCKSLSKVLALSGLRVGYLCGPPELMSDLLVRTPPWAVGLPGQLAAVAALSRPEYYRRRYRQTHILRARLEERLRALGLEVIPGSANFVLVFLPEDGPDATTVVERCRRAGLYIRDASASHPCLGARALRLAIKGWKETRELIAVLACSLGTERAGAS
jgi:histidinol-phosphate/aromatic aminotransferase/cobyric acid decarboxylase-like protein